MAGPARMGSAGLVWDQKPTFFGILDLGDFWPGRLGWARMGSDGLGWARLGPETNFFWNS